MQKKKVSSKQEKTDVYTLMNVGKKVFFGRRIEEGEESQVEDLEMIGEDKFEAIGGFISKIEKPLFYSKTMKTKEGKTFEKYLLALLLEPAGEEPGAKIWLDYQSRGVSTLLSCWLNDPGAEFSVSASWAGKYTAVQVETDAQPLYSREEIPAWRKGDPEEEFVFFRQKVRELLGEE